MPSSSPNKVDPSSSLPNWSRAKSSMTTRKKTPSSRKDRGIRSTRYIIALVHQILPKTLWTVKNLRLNKNMALRILSRDIRQEISLSLELRTRELESRARIGLSCLSSLESSKILKGWIPKELDWVLLFLIILSRNLKDKLVLNQSSEEEVPSCLVCFLEEMMTIKTSKRETWTWNQQECQKLQPNQPLQIKLNLDCSLIKNNTARSGRWTQSKLLFLMKF